MVEITEFTEEEQRRIIEESGVLKKMKDRERVNRSKNKAPTQLVYDSDEASMEESEEEEESEGFDSDEEDESEGPPKETKPFVDIRKDAKRRAAARKAAAAASKEVTEGVDVEEDVVFMTALLAIPLTILQSGLDYVIHEQYSMGHLYNGMYILTHSIPFFVALFVIIYTTSLFKRSLWMQVVFSVTGAMSGVHIVKVSMPGMHLTFGEMLSTSGVAVLWIYSVIQSRLGYVICSAGVPLVYYFLKNKGESLTGVDP